MGNLVLLMQGQAIPFFPMPPMQNPMQVVSVAAGKHHMLVATKCHEVWSWGSGMDGKLGYTEQDTQPVPKKWVQVQEAEGVVREIQRLGDRVNAAGNSDECHSATTGPAFFSPSTHL